MSQLCLTLPEAAWGQGHLHPACTSGPGAGWMPAERLQNWPRLPLPGPPLSPRSTHPGPGPCSSERIFFPHRWAPTRGTWADQRSQVSSGPAAGFHDQRPFSGQDHAVLIVSLRSPPPASLLLKTVSAALAPCIPL